MASLSRALRPRNNLPSCSPQQASLACSSSPTSPTTNSAASLAPFLPAKPSLPSLRSNSRLLWWVSRAFASTKFVSSPRTLASKRPAWPPSSPPLLWATNRTNSRSGSTTRTSSSNSSPLPKALRAADRSAQVWDPAADPVQDQEPDSVPDWVLALAAVKAQELDLAAALDSARAPELVQASVPVLSQAQAPTGPRTVPRPSSFSLTLSSSPALVATFRLQAVTRRAHH